MWLHALFFLSGGAGLGYQMVWSRMFAPGLGHEMPAVLAVVAAFMGGMALGAWTLDRAVCRSARPGLWYAGLEGVIGAWGLVSTGLIPAANRAAAGLIGLEPSAPRHWGVAFVLPFLALLPATAAMGATFPAMERFASPFTRGQRCVGALYSANTLGAVAGILATTFWIAPAWGLAATVRLLATINLLCGITAWILGCRLSAAGRSAGARAAGNALEAADAGQVAAVEQSRAAATDAFPSPWRLGLTLFLTGLFGIGYEVVGVRVLSQVMENTVYSFAAALSVYLLGASAGAALQQRLGGARDPRLHLTSLLAGVALSCLLGVQVLARSAGLHEACRAALGGGMLAATAAEMAVAAATLALPSLLMGATFSCLAQAARRPDGGVGGAVAVNTLGGALAGAVFGVALLPLFGARWTLVTIALGYLALLPGLAGWRRSLAIPLFVIGLLLPARLELVDMPPGGRVIEYREGVMASVAVVEDASRQRTLRVNNRFQMGGTAAAAAEYRQADIPLLLHPDPKRALVLGLGTGITLGAAGLYPGLESDGVELVPEVVEVMRHFEPHNFAPDRQAQIRIQAADARRFVQATDARYDVIIGDLFHPARDGAGSLYTVEHFTAIRARLAPGGLFCQWLPLYQLDEPMLRVIVRTFLQVFPDAQAWLLHLNVDTPVLGLIGGAGPRAYADGWVERRLTSPGLAGHLKQLSLADSIRLFGNLVAGPAELRMFSGDAPLNTDDQPRVTFGAPEFAHRGRVAPYGRLLTLLDASHPDPQQVLALGPGSETAPFSQRIGRYLAARDHYLRGLVAESEQERSKAIDAYLESARVSEDFTAGYAQCLTLASLLAKEKPAEARGLLQRLVQAQPSRPVAREMLKRLFGE